MEKILGVAEAREKFSEIVEQVQYRGQAFIISRHGKPAAAVVPVDVFESWKRQRESFFNAIRQIQEANPEADPAQVWEDVLKAQQAARRAGQ